MIIDTLEAWWNTLIELTRKFVIPDWGALVGLLPILLLIGVVGPILTLLVLVLVPLLRAQAARQAWRSPRSARPAPLDAAGNPVFPVGEPYSPSERRDLRAGRDPLRRPARTLVVACPKCRSSGPRRSHLRQLRPVLQPQADHPIAPPAGPPPGGRAAA